MTRWPQQLCPIASVKVRVYSACLWCSSWIGARVHGLKQHVRHRRRTATMRRAHAISSAAKGDNLIAAGPRTASHLREDKARDEVSSKGQLLHGAITGSASEAKSTNKAQNERKPCQPSVAALPLAARSLSAEPLLRVQRDNMFLPPPRGLSSAVPPASLFAACPPAPPSLLGARCCRREGS